MFRKIPPSLLLLLLFVVVSLYTIPNVSSQIILFDPPEKDEDSNLGFDFDELFQQPENATNVTTTEDLEIPGESSMPPEEPPLELPEEATLNPSILELPDEDFTTVPPDELSLPPEMMDEYTLPPGLEVPGNMTSAYDDLVALALENPDLSTFVELAMASDLFSKLNNSDGPITIFAPTNEAFEQAVDEATVTYLLSEEGKPELLDVLLYHVYDMGGLLVTDFMPLPGLESDLPMANGDVAFIEENMINNATIVGPDSIISDNLSVIHLINSVLFPPEDESMSDENVTTEELFDGNGTETMEPSEEVETDDAGDEMVPANETEAPETSDENTTQSQPPPLPPSSENNTDTDMDMSGSNSTNSSLPPENTLTPAARTITLTNGINVEFDSDKAFPAPEDLNIVTNAIGELFTSFLELGSDDADGTSDSNASNVEDGTNQSNTTNSTSSRRFLAPFWRRRLATLAPGSIDIYDTEQVPCNETTAAARNRMLQNDTDTTTVAATGGNDTITCYKLSFSYDLVLDDSEDPDVVAEQWENSVQEAVDGGLLEEALLTVDPDAPFSVQGSTQPAELPPPSSASPGTTPSPTETGSGEQTSSPTQQQSGNNTASEGSENKDSGDDDDDDDDPNVLAIVLGTVFGFLGCILLLICAVFGGSIAAISAVLCCCCSSGSAGNNNDDEGKNENEEKASPDEENPEEAPDANNETFDQAMEDEDAELQPAATRTEEDDVNPSTIEEGDEAADPSTIEEEDEAADPATIEEEDGADFDDEADEADEEKEVNDLD